MKIVKRLKTFQKGRSVADLCRVSASAAGIFTIDIADGEGVAEGGGDGGRAKTNRIRTELLSSCDFRMTQYEYCYQNDPKTKDCRDVTIYLVSAPSVVNLSVL
jgi:hypothetical protein